MKKELISSVVGIALVCSVVFLAGCGANRVDLIDSGSLNLEKKASGKVYVAWSDVYEDEKGFVVTGVLRRRDRVGLPIKTEVCVTLLSPDGTVLDEAHSSEVYVPRRIIGKFRGFKRFRVRFENMPPEGSLVRIAACSKLQDDES
ncbi:MAG TPA: hypothetical protein HPP66_00670 [Planctomycetes bacterium]|nr:hypothetical protein [Planctomycetota bacterium]